MMNDIVGKTFAVSVLEDFIKLDFVSKVIWTDGEGGYKFENGVTLYNWGSANIQEVQN